MTARAGRDVRLALAALLATAAVLSAAACGGGAAPTAGGSATAAPDAAGSATPPAHIRLALAPDPVWQWLVDSGLVARWETDNNIRIDASSPFDQFSAFAGGHADVVVINAMDVPQFVEQSDREPVIIGVLSTDRSFLGVRRTSRAETLDDLVETTISVDGDLGSTLLWGLIAEAMHGLDFRVDGADFDLVVVEPASVADLVMRGDADACICVAELSVSALSSGRLRPLYDGDSAAEIYAEGVLGDPDALPIADAFVVDRAWHEQNGRAVAALLSLWEQGLQNWSIQKGQLIAAYPHLFAVQSDEEIAWVIDYVAQDDWTAESVYLTLQDRAVHTGIFAEMQRIGLVDDDVAVPAMDLSYSPVPGG